MCPRCESLIPTVDAVHGTNLFENSSHAIDSGVDEFTIDLKPFGFDAFKLTVKQPSTATEEQDP